MLLLYQSVVHNFNLSCYWWGSLDQSSVCQASLLKSYSLSLCNKCFWGKYFEMIKIFHLSLFFQFFCWFDCGFIISKLLFNCSDYYYLNKIHFELVPASVSRASLKELLCPFDTSSSFFEYLFDFWNKMFHALFLLSLALQSAIFPRSPGSF